MSFRIALIFLLMLSGCAPEPTVEPNLSIIVRLGGEGQIEVNGKPLFAGELSGEIARIRALDPSAPVVIIPHTQTENDQLTWALDASRKAGVVNITLTDSRDDYSWPEKTAPTD